MASCTEAESPESDSRCLDFDTEVLRAIADAAHCLHIAEELPKIDFMETVIRDCLILNKLRAFNSEHSGVDDRDVRFAEWRGRNMILLLTAMEPLLIELLDSLLELSRQLKKLAQASLKSAGLSEQIQGVCQKVDGLTEALRLGAELARDPESIYCDGIYGPQIRTVILEVMGSLLKIREH